ncbi:MAG: hypothetical protein R3E93_05720 [Thiothrix sp.]
MQPLKPDAFSEWTFEDIAKRWWSYRDFTEKFRQLFNDVDDEYKFKRRVTGYFEQRQKNGDFDVNGRHDPYQKSIRGGILEALEDNLFQAMERNSKPSDAELSMSDTLKIIALLLELLKDKRLSQDVVSSELASERIQGLGKRKIDGNFFLLQTGVE